MAKQITLERRTRCTKPPKSFVCLGGRSWLGCLSFTWAYSCKCFNNLNHRSLCFFHVSSLFVKFVRITTYSCLNASLSSHLPSLLPFYWTSNGAAAAISEREPVTQSPFFHQVVLVHSKAQPRRNTSVLCQSSLVGVLLVWRHPQTSSWVLNQVRGARLPQPGPSSE